MYINNMQGSITVIQIIGMMMVQTSGVDFSKAGGVYA